MKSQMVNYKLIGKCLYFPVERVLCVGDLHLGFERMLHEEGVMFPIGQMAVVKEELSEIFEEIFRRYGIKKVDRIVILGDVKHYFKFDKGEKNDFFEILEFLRGFIDNAVNVEEGVVVIRGNHDKNDSFSGFIDSYVYNGIGFLHGHRMFSEVLDKNVAMIVMGHLHSSVNIIDSADVKNERYKCFVIGNWRGKKVIGVPSFLPFIEGGKLSDYKDDAGIVSKKELGDFEVFVVNKDLKEGALSFGKLKDFD